jgi:antitoxin ParD1/3/4
LGLYAPFEDGDMTTLSISLPENLKSFVEEQTVLGGFPTPGDYIRSVLREAQDRRDRDELEGKLLVALEADAVEMDQADWDQMRERVRQTAKA